MQVIHLLVVRLTALGSRALSEICLSSKPAEFEEVTQLLQDEGGVQRQTETPEAWLPF